MNSPFVENVLKSAEKMLSNVNTVIFVDHNHETKYVLTDGIWKGPWEEFPHENFIHMVAQFWIIYQGKERYYYTLSYKEGYHV